MSKVKSIVLVLAGIAVGMLIMFGINTVMYGNKDNMFTDPDVQWKMDVLLDNIDSTFYFDYDKDDIYEGIYKGMVKGLDDPYSEYMTEEEYKYFAETNAGSFYGVGITILDEDDSYRVINIEEDSPAERAGIKVDDYIIEVNGKSYDTLEALVSNLRGEEGTEVTVKVLRNNDPLEITMERAEIQEKSVVSDVLDGNIGYIAISSFIETTDDDFKEALSDMENKEVKGLIIDLRNNGGGLLDESLNIADMLLDEGTMITYYDKNGNTETEESEAGCTDLNYVVLVNGNTASASEALAAAIKDNEGGKIVGEKTFGKGIIQKTMKLYDGSAIKLTSNEYRSPDGHKIHKKGVKPDVKVKNTENSDLQLEKAKELLN